jgi:secreted PhoX family phosphatase
VGAKATDATLRRFLVGPLGAELTGLTESHDGRALFVNIQHPGEDTTAADFAAGPGSYQSGWPYGSDAQATPTTPRPRPRSATIVITKNDGGVIGS